MCKNHKHSSTPITDLKKAKSRANCHSQYCYRENKISRNTTNKGCKGSPQGELQTRLNEMREDKTDSETFYAHI